MKEDKQQYEINMGELMGKVYFKIATWNNDHEGTDQQKSDSLKLVSHDIITTVLSEIASATGSRTKEVVLAGEEAKKSNKGFMSNFLRKDDANK